MFTTSLHLIIILNFIFSTSYKNSQCLAPSTIFKRHTVANGNRFCVLCLCVRMWWHSLSVCFCPLKKTNWFGCFYSEVSDILAHSFLVTKPLDIHIKLYAGYISCKLKFLSCSSSDKRLITVFLAVLVDRTTLNSGTLHELNGGVGGPFDHKMYLLKFYTGYL